MLLVLQHFPAGAEGQAYWVHLDGRGSVAGLTKHQGQSPHNYRYDAYGLLLPANGSFTDPHNHYTFAGKEWDEHLGLYEFGVRLYDPWAGVWLTREPLAGDAWEPRTWHRYQYAFANPISYYDPYGMQVPPPVTPVPAPTPPPYTPAPRPTPTPGPSPTPTLTPSQMPTAMPEGAQCTPSPLSQPLTPVEKAGLILTGVVTTVGIVAAEVTLVIVEVALLDIEPVGAAIDVFVITPIELFLIDVDVALWAMIYRSITTGEKQPVILLPPWGLEK